MNRRGHRRSKTVRQKFSRPQNRRGRKKPMNIRVTRGVMIRLFRGQIRGSLNGSLRYPTRRRLKLGRVPRFPLIASRRRYLSSSPSVMCVGKILILRFRFVRKLIPSSLITSPHLTCRPRTTVRSRRRPFLMGQSVRLRLLTVRSLISRPLIPVLTLLDASLRQNSWFSGPTTRRPGSRSFIQARFRLPLMW